MKREIYVTEYHKVTRIDTSYGHLRIQYLDKSTNGYYVWKPVLKWDTSTWPLQTLEVIDEYMKQFEKYNRK